MVEYPDRCVAERKLFLDRDLVATKRGDHAFPTAAGTEQLRLDCLLSSQCSEDDDFVRHDALRSFFRRMGECPYGFGEDGGRCSDRRKKNRSGRRRLVVISFFHFYLVPNSSG